MIDVCKTPKLDKAGKPTKDRRGDPIMQNNDQWFILQFKLAWREGPKEETSGATSLMMTPGRY